MLAITVGGFEHQVIGFGNHIGIGHDRVVITAQVTREHQFTAVPLNLDHRCAKDMTCTMQLDLDIRTQIMERVARQRLELLQDLAGLFGRVQRQRRLM